MAAGKPIIAAINGATSSLINEMGCGVVVSSVECKKADVISKLDKNTIEKIGKVSRDCYMKSFNKIVYISKICEYLTKTIRDDYEENKNHY